VLFFVGLILSDNTAQYRLAREAATLPDVRITGKITESVPVNGNTVRLRLDDGTAVTLKTSDAIPAGVTAALRRTGKTPEDQKNWLCLKALSTESIKCYRLQGVLF
jgi:ribosomal protein S4E